MIYIPAGCTDELQPLDVSVNKLFKDYYRQYLEITPMPLLASKTQSERQHVINAVSYSWNNGSVNDPLMHLSAGVYILNISDARPCFDTLLFTVTEPSEISVSTLTLPTQCYNSQDGGMEIIPAGGNGGYSFFINNQAYSQSPVNGLSGGTYNLFVQDSLGCLSSTTSITIPSPSPISISTSITPESAQNVSTGARSPTH